MVIGVKDPAFSKMAKRYSTERETSPVNALEQAIVERFKSLLRERLTAYRLVLFGSRVRGDSDVCSDMNVLVILDGECDESTTQFVSDCAWEAGYEQGIVMVPVVFSNRGMGRRYRAFFAPGQSCPTGRYRAVKEQEAEELIVARLDQAARGSD